MKKQFPFHKSDLYTVFIFCLVIFASLTLKTGFGPWPWNLLLSLLSSMILRLCCGSSQVEKAGHTALPHDHQHRLCYVGGLNGWAVECPLCGQRWLLHEDYAFFIRGGVYTLGTALAIVLLLFPVLGLPAVPDAYDLLLMMWLLLPSQLLAHSAAWLFLRRRDPSALIAPETEDSPSA